MWIKVWKGWKGTFLPCSEAQIPELMLTMITLELDPVCPYILSSTWKSEGGVVISCGPVSMVGAALPFFGSGLALRCSHTPSKEGTAQICYHELRNCSHSRSIRTKQGNPWTQLQDSQFYSQFCYLLPVGWPEWHFFFYLFLNFPDYIMENSNTRFASFLSLYPAG